MENKLPDYAGVVVSEFGLSASQMINAREASELSLQFNRGLGDGLS
jgi:hypothetical protein